MADYKSNAQLSLRCDAADVWTYTISGVLCAPKDPKYTKSTAIQDTGLEQATLDEAKAQIEAALDAAGGDYQDGYALTLNNTDGNTWIYSISGVSSDSDDPAYKSLVQLNTGLEKQTQADLQTQVIAALEA